LDLTFWLLVFIITVQISKSNYKKISIRLYNPIFLIILPMTFMILISILSGELTSYSWSKIRDFIIIFIPTVITSFWVVRNKNDFRYLGNGVLALGLYASFYIYINPIFQAGGNISYLFSGTLTGLGGLVSAHRFLSESGRKGFYFFAFCICSIGVLISYARGQQLIYIFVLLIVLVNHYFSSSVKMQKKIMVALSLFALLVLIFIGYSYKLDKGEDILWRFKPQYFMEAAELRILLLREAIKMFGENTIIPAGVGKYVVEVVPYIFTYPHNLPLEFAAELGLLGVIYYLFIIIGALCGYSRFRHLTFIRENLFLFLFIFLCSLKQGSIYQDKAFWVWTAFGIGLLGWHTKSTYQNPRLDQQG